MVYICTGIVPTCPPPPVVYNSISKQTGVYVGDVVTYSCKPGHKMLGGGNKRSIVCLKNLKWSHIDAEACES